MSACTAEVVPLGHLDARLCAAWSELARSAAEPNPFFEPEVLLPAARLLPGGAGVGLLVVRRGGDLVLAAPVHRGRYRRMPVRALSTWRHPYRYLGTPLVRPDALCDAPAALLRTLAGHAAWLVLDQLYVDGPVAGALRAGARERGASWVEHEVWERPAVRARQEDTYLEETLSARSAKALRRRRRNLERDLGPVRARDTARSGDLRAELEAFLALEAAGWKGRSGTALASSPAHAQFFREMCLALAADGRLELWRLDAGERTTARQCHLRAGEVVFHFKTTYDEQLARYSPGVQLELDVLAAFHEDPALAQLDPCTDPEPGTSDRLYPDSRRLGVALVGLTPAGRLAAHGTPHAVHAARRLRERARS